MLSIFKRGNMQKNIGTINRLVSEIAKGIGSDSEQYDALVRMHEVITLLGNEENERILINNEESIEFVMELLEEIKREPTKLKFFAEQIKQVIKQLLNGNGFDTAGNEAERKGNTLNYKYSVAYNEAKALQDEMQEIANEIVSKNIKNGSLEYRLLSANYENLRIKSETQLAYLDNLSEIITRNTKIAGVSEREKALEEMKSLSAMGLDDFVSMAQRVRTMTAQQKRESEIFDSIYQSAIEDSSSTPSSNSYLDAHVEKTRLEKLYDQSGEQHSEFMDKLSEIHTDELIKDIAVLYEKIDALADKIDSGNEENAKRLEKLEKLIDESNESLLLRKDVKDIEDSVNNFLSVDPKDMQSASLKIRSCIENYVRYKYGVNMTDKLLFPGNTYVIDKLTMAGVPENLAKKLARIYGDTNPYVHNQVEEISKKSTKERENEIRSALKFIKENGIDKVDCVDGVKLLYTKQDEIIKNYCDSKRKIDLDLVGYAIRDQEKRREFLESEGVAVPNVTFKTMEDVQEYINSKTESAPANPSEPEELKSSVPEESKSSEPEAPKPSTPVAPKPSVQEVAPKKKHTTPEIEEGATRYGKVIVYGIDESTGCEKNIIRDKTGFTVRFFQSQVDYDSTHKIGVGSRVSYTAKYGEDRYGNRIIKVSNIKVVEGGRE